MPFVPSDQIAKPTGEQPAGVYYRWFKGDVDRLGSGQKWLAFMLAVTLLLSVGNAALSLTIFLRLFK